MRSYIVATVLLFATTCNAQIGRSCTTPNGESARCISIYDCDTLLNVITTKDESQIEFLRKSQCGFQKWPLVCCGTATNYQPNSPDTASTNIPESSTSTTVSNITDNLKCGLHSGNKILQGTVTDLDEFPWMALLNYQNANGDVRFACGGTLISSRYVLTAAHCVVGRILTSVGKPYQVRLGEHNRTTNPDCLYPQICNDPYEEFGIEEVIAHPGYTDNNINRYDDIALIRLDRDAPYTLFIRPLCLPSVSDQSNAGDILTVAGWGRTSTERNSSIKLKLEIPLVDKNQCSVRFRTAGVTLNNKQICAGGLMGKSTCQGDSGGPLMRRKSDSAQWYIEGITSFGAQCGAEDWPTIFTRVEGYTDWINANVH